MSDPAVDAAQRHADTLPYGVDGRLRGDDLVAAAREALKPIRELHRKSPMYDLTDDCEICSDEDDKVSEQHAKFESANGDWLCAAEVVAYCCRHCTEIGGCSCYEPVDWPCETAKLIYTTEELER